MSHQRIAISAIICLAIAGLTLWQFQRERAMQACLAAGNHWNGPASSCDRVRLAPILQRDLLKRT